MTDIRINQLPAEASPVATDVVPIDGATTRKTTIQDLVLIGRPTASQAEAEAGTNPTKVMTPLTTKQSIASEVGVSLASAAQGVLADGAAQKAQNLSDLADKGTAQDNIQIGAAFADVSTAQGATVAARNKRLRTQFYATANRTGGANYRRISFADLGSTPALAYFRSTDRFMPDGSTDNTNGGYWVLDENVTSPAMFGILGNASDEQTAVQALLTFSAGKAILGEQGKTYGFNFLSAPLFTEFLGVGFQFRRLTPSTSSGFSILGDFRAAYFKVTSPGGAAERLTRILGSNVDLGYIHLQADAQVTTTVANTALTISSNPAGTTLSNIRIRGGYCENFATFIDGTLLTSSDIRNVTIKNYRTSVYLKDTTNSTFSRIYSSGLGANVNGSPGENGLLLEATAPYATSDLTFDDWIVEDSGEHAYRLGGQQTMARITFNRCVSRRSGSSILSGNLTSGEWHGGCGFKVLGGGTVGGTRHKDIIYNECKVFDVNQTFGTYPAGHGVNNFTPFMIVLADGVQLNGCVVDGEDLATSCRYGLLTSCCNGVFVNDCDFRKCELTALKPYQESLFPGFPGYEAPLTEFHVHGGKFEVVTAAASGGIVYNMFENATFAHKNWSIKDAKFRGGAQALRVEATGVGGSYTNCIAEFTYLDPTSVTDAAATSPIITGDGVANWICDFKSVNRPSAFGVTVANGSVHTRLDTAKAYDRIGGSWYERIVQSTSGYTPTSTIITNLDAATPSFCYFYRVNDMVHVFGQVTMDAALSGAISARITLPIASNFTASRQASGTFDSSDGTVHGSISGDTTNDQLVFAGNSSVTSARACSFLATYAII